MRRALLVLLAATAALLGSPGPAAAAPGPADAPEYWFDDWHVPQLWADGARGQGVVIAEIDTGVNASLPELSGRVLKGTDLGRRGDGRTDREVDAFGHGTAMASIMVARPGPFGITGLAPGAKILPIAVPLEGTTDADEPDDLPTAIRYAADHGAKIISMSLGGKRSPRADNVPCPDDEQAAVLHALRKGSIVVASVGNTGPTRNAVEDPGACLGVVSVGAVDSRGTVAGFSARQPYLTLVAPGVAVPSLGRVPGQAYSGRGTSQSAAIASAALALVWSRFPHESGRAVVTRTLHTLAGRRSRPSRAYGYGLIDPYRAITGSVPAGTANPVYDLAAPFLARDAAFASAGPGRAPPAAGVNGTPPGDYAVGSAPRLLTVPVLTGAGLALAGLVLLVLCGFGVRRNRHRAVVDVALPPWPPAPLWLRDPLDLSEPGSDLHPEIPPPPAVGPLELRPLVVPTSDVGPLDLRPPDVPPPPAEPPRRVGDTRPRPRPGPE